MKLIKIGNNGGMVFYLVSFENFGSVNSHTIQQSQEFVGSGNYNFSQDRGKGKFP